MLKLTAALLLVAAGCGQAPPAAESPPPKSDEPARGHSQEPAREQSEQDQSLIVPQGFVEGSFGNVSRSGTQTKLVLQGKGGSSVALPIDEATAEFVERFRKDRDAAISWAKSHPELKAAIAIAPRVKRVHYEIEGDGFAFHVFDERGELESTHPHVVILVSRAPFFVAVEALEGFAY